MAAVMWSHVTSSGSRYRLRGDVQGPRRRPGELIDYVSELIGYPAIAMLNVLIQLQLRAKIHAQLRIVAVNEFRGTFINSVFLLAFEPP